MQNRIAIWIACDEAGRRARANLFSKQFQGITSRAFRRGECRQLAVRESDH
jgi:hypothetical protein